MVHVCHAVLNGWLYAYAVQYVLGPGHHSFHWMPPYWHSLRCQHSKLVCSWYSNFCLYYDTHSFVEWGGRGGIEGRCGGGGEVWRGGEVGRGGGGGGEEVGRGLATAALSTLTSFSTLDVPFGNSGCIDMTCTPPNYLHWVIQPLPSQGNLAQQLTSIVRCIHTW